MRNTLKCAASLAVTAALGVALAGCRDAGDSVRPALVSTSPVLATATLDFEYDGGPIHPKLVQHFSGWLSDDASPVVVAVDVSAATQARNEYHRDGVRVDEKGVWYAESPTQQFGYKYLGSMTNGTCVLMTWEWGGGSGVFGDLLLVKFQEHRKNGHLLIYVVGRYALGDRGADHVTVHPGSVEVAAAKTREGEWPRRTIRAGECVGALDL